MIRWKRMFWQKLADSFRAYKKYEFEYNIEQYFDY